MCEGFCACQRKASFNTPSCDVVHHRKRIPQTQRENKPQICPTDAKKAKNGESINPESKKRSCAQQSPLVLVFCALPAARRDFASQKSDVRLLSLAAFSASGLALARRRSRAQSAPSCSGASVPPPRPLSLAPLCRSFRLVSSFLASCVAPSGLCGWRSWLRCQRLRTVRRWVRVRVGRAVSGLGALPWRFSALAAVGWRRASAPCSRPVCAVAGLRAAVPPSACVGAPFLGRVVKVWRLPRPLGGFPASLRPACRCPRSLRRPLAGCCLALRPVSRPRLASGRCLCGLLASGLRSACFCVLFRVGSSPFPRRARGALPPSPRRAPAGRPRAVILAGDGGQPPASFALRAKSVARGARALPSPLSWRLSSRRRFAPPCALRLPRRVRPPRAFARRSPPPSGGRVRVVKGGF